MLPRNATLIVACLLLPSVSASWSAFGAHEPDSSADVRSFAYFDPPGYARDRIYFSGFVVNGHLNTNANVGLTGSALEPIGVEWHQAILGVWADCNSDGYVGMAESALREYPKELLLDDSVCPAATGPTNKWTPGAFNYNGWVSEFISIGPLEDMDDRRIIVDNQARIWGDYGLPDGQDARPSCAMTSFPPGGARTTGRILDHVDCHLDVVLDTQTANEYNALLAQADPSDSLGLALREDSWGQTWGHPLNGQTFGDASDSNAFVQIAECDEEIQLTDESPPGSDLDNLYTFYPDVPPSLNTEGTIAGTIMGLKHHVDRNDDHESNSVCDNDRDNNADFYGLFEGETYDVDARIKRAPNFVMRHHTQARGTAPLALPQWPGAAGAPADLGVEALVDACTWGGCAPTRWYASEANLRSLPSILKVDVVATDVQIADAYTMTYYAHVSSQTTDRGFRLPGAQGVYGAGACGENDGGIHNGWDCDPTAWYPDGPPGLGHWYTWNTLPRPGSPYELRDVDCYDGDLADTTGLGLGAGAPYYGPRPCN